MAQKNASYDSPFYFLILNINLGVLTLLSLPHWGRGTALAVDEVFLSCVHSFATFMLPLARPFK